MLGRSPGQERFAEVALPLPLLQTFTYAIPEHFVPTVALGSRILVPFGPRHLTGFVVGFKTKAQVSGLKPVVDALDALPVLDRDMLALTKWVADYYLSSWGEAIKCALPAGLYQESRRRISLGRPIDAEALDRLAKRAPRQAAILRLLSQRKWVPVSALTEAFGVDGLHSSLHALERQGLVAISDDLTKPRAQVRRQRVVFPLVDAVELGPKAEELSVRAPRQAACLRVFAQGTKEIPRLQLSKRWNIPGGVIRRLIDKGLLAERFREIRRDPFEEFVPEPAEAVCLTPAQQETLGGISRAIEEHTFYPILLLGVTGSGKTEIYLRSIAEVLERGRGAIVLVPEISLTPQTVRRFRAVFGDQVAVLHSRLSPGERYDTWRSIQEGGRRIVVGARSAVFAPVPNLGLIVVDEEHDASYKQHGVSPRYHARDVAAVRAKAAHAVVVFGSATPSLESYHNAKGGKYHLSQLPGRISVVSAQADHPMPEVTVVDMRAEVQRGNRSLFSTLLRQRIKDRLARKQRTILLQNRRGYSPFVQCGECGFVMGCPNCRVSLTYHAQGHWMRCHYCGARQKAPSVCPSCRGRDLRYVGTGTQKVEEALKRAFPEARVIRMDTDTTRRKHAHDRLLGAFRKGEGDVLLGTQMVAKGLDFPGVTLVGVISADTGLYFPDFRAEERTFQLLTQVAGRAGRGDVRGEVVIQTFSPDNEAIGFAQNHDFLSFAEKELAARAELDYPPFGRLICVLFSGEDQEAVSSVARAFAKGVGGPASDGIEVLGPVEAPLARIKKQFRWQVVLKGTAPNAMRDLARNAAAKVAAEAGRRKVKVTIDVDPVEML